MPAADELWLSVQARVGRFWAGIAATKCSLLFLAKRDTSARLSGPIRHASASSVAYSPSFDVACDPLLEVHASVGGVL